MRQLYSSKPSGNGCGLVVIDDEFSGGTSSADWFIFLWTENLSFIQKLFAKWWNIKCYKFEPENIKFNLIWWGLIHFIKLSAKMNADFYINDSNRKTGAHIAQNLQPRSP